jgi:hypothetical protein
MEIPSTGSAKGVCFINSRSVWLAETEARIFKYYSEFEETETEQATSYQSIKEIFQQNIQKSLCVYQAGNRIFASQFDGTTLYPRIQLGAGEYPTIALDISGNLCAIWERDVNNILNVGGGELWISKFDGIIWSIPYLLTSFIGPFNLDVNPSSFIIDPVTNLGYVVFEWRDRYLNGPNSHLYLGVFDVNDPATIQFSEIEFAPNPERCEFPSISLGGNYLYIVFQREDMINRTKWDIINHQVVDRIPISEEGRFSHHPYCDVQANGRVNYIWEDSTANNIEIFWKYEGQTLPRNVSHTPGKSQWPQICKGTTWVTWSEYIYPPTDNNWEIFYKDMEYEGYQDLSQTLEMSKYSHSVVNRSPFWPPPYVPKLTAIWTEGGQMPYEIRTKTVVLPEIPYFYVDAGNDEASAWTIQRAGYIQFTPEPEKTIDYHPQKLIYHFSNLNPVKRYHIKLVLYFESQNPHRWRMRINGDNILHANIWITSGEITTVERVLPTACYKDGELYLNIENLIGDYALVSQIYIYESEREIEYITKNTQISEILPANKTGIYISPNPMSSAVKISYLLPTSAQYHTNLKIYDSSGRLIRQFENSTNCKNLKNQIFWNGTDENGRILPKGIYFIVLEFDTRRLTEKLILLK